MHSYHPVIILTEKGGMIGTLQEETYFHPKICETAKAPKPPENSFGELAYLHAVSHL